MTKAEQLHKNKEPKPRQRKCKQCRQWFTPDNKYQETCSVECAIEYAPKKMAKEKRKSVRQFRETDKAVLMRKAQAIFNKYIRLRDKGLPCISCGHIGNRQRHAGHFMPVGSNGNLRFDEDNCHSQCSICNNWKSGNLAEYETNLRKKIGNDRVDRLKEKGVRVWTVEELRAIILSYNEKIKALNG